MKSDNFISKHKILLVSVGVLAVLLAALILALCLRPGGDDPTVPTDSGPPDVTEDTGQATGPGDTDPTDPNSTEPTVTEPTVKPDEDITCEQFASFSGAFVEDGKDEPVENVAAILVKNRTDRFLDLATITYDVDGKEATFVVTGLPAGATAWVMESTAMTVSADATFTYVDCVKAFRNDVVSTAEEITVQSNGTMLRAVNNTDRTLENVFVYYKVVHTDGNFFGGITYSVNFGTLEPGASVEKLAGHYTEGWTEIVRIGWQESQTDEAS